MRQYIQGKRAVLRQSSDDSFHVWLKHTRTHSLRSSRWPLIYGQHVTAAMMSVNVSLINWACTYYLMNRVVSDGLKEGHGFKSHQLNWICKRCWCVLSQPVCLTPRCHPWYFLLQHNVPSGPWRMERRLIGNKWLQPGPNIWRRAFPEAQEVQEYRNFGNDNHIPLQRMVVLTENEFLHHNRHLQTHTYWYISAGPDAVCEKSIFPPEASLSWSSDWNSVSFTSFIQSDTGLY